MKKIDDLMGYAAIIFALAVSCVLLGYIISNIARGNSYKEGQIDALTGKIKYELVTNDDMTKTWELIGEEK
jgi:hypothetical protein